MDFKKVYLEVIRLQPFLTIEDAEDVSSFIVSEKWLGNDLDTEDLIKVWKKENKDWHLENAKSFTAINDEGTTDDWILNREAMNEYYNNEEYCDEERLKPSEELEIFFENLGLEKGVRSWIKNLYQMNLELMNKLSLISGRKRSSLLTKTTTSRIL